jgi:winged helix DNA-binding protein
MKGRRLLDHDDVRRLRSAAQHLHRPHRRSAADLVGHLTGVQAQVFTAAGLALRARTEGLTRAAVARARLRDRSIVLTWAMRGTLHLISAEDYGWLHPLVIERGIANAYRRLGQLGVLEGQPERAVALISRMLDREGPLVRSEIAERLARQGIVTEGQAIAHLMWLAGARGVVCYGPDRGNEQCFVLVSDWIGEPKPRERETALVELAVRYLRAHGPAEPADLASWSGIGLGDAKRAWQLVEGRIAAYETSRGQLWTLRGQTEEAPRGLVRLLPAFDEYLLGWKDRAFLAPPEQWRKINRGGGWLHPVVLSDGRAVATWSSERAAGALRIRIAPFSANASMSRRAVAAEARVIGSFLGLGAEVTIG